MASSKGNNRNNKKLEEVKEVIQNKPDTDILRILEVFDNDVSKTINAFMTDSGKDALSKWTSLKKNEKKTNNNNKKQSATSEGAVNNFGEIAANTNTKLSPNKKINKKQYNNSLPNKGKGNINDLVSSIINQSISTTDALSNLQSEATSQTKLNVDSDASLNVQIQQQQNILNNLNNLIISSSQPCQKSNIGGFKMTVLGIEQPVENSKVTSVNQSSINSSPVSISPSFNGSNQNDKQKVLANNKLNNLDNMNKNTSTLPVHPLVSHINRSYINPNNTKNFVNILQKDVKYQLIQLDKISSQFQEELTKSKINIKQTFTFLHNLLDQREAELQLQLNSVSQNVLSTLNQRQQTANQLKNLADNVIHLNDQDTSVLKEDIKHLANERVLDERFGKAKLFSEANYEKLHEAISNYGLVSQLNNIETTTSHSSSVKASNQSNMFQQQNNQHNNINNNIKTPKKNSVNNYSVNSKPGTEKHSIKIVDVDTLSDCTNDDEGEFIEVKKPQRNKNKQQLNGAVNGMSNGHQQQQQQQQSNGSGNNKKSKKKQNNTVVSSMQNISKANQNPFSLIANGKY